jgi:hypothetical protein
MVGYASSARKISLSKSARHPARRHQDREARAAKREWAGAHGFHAADRGLLSDAAEAAYAEAHKLPKPSNTPIAASVRRRADWPGRTAGCTKPKRGRLSQVR